MIYIVPITTHWFCLHICSLSLPTQILNLDKSGKIKTSLEIMFTLSSWQCFSIPSPPIWRWWRRPDQRPGRQRDKPEYRQVVCETWLQRQRWGWTVVGGCCVGSRWGRGSTPAPTFYPEIFLVKNGPGISSQPESRNTRDFHCSWRQREGKGSKWARPSRRTAWGERRITWSYPSQYTHTCQTKIFRTVWSTSMSRTLPRNC